VICPYAVNRKVVTQTRMTYDENGQQTSWMEAQQNTAEFVKCQKEECGAFQDGKCCYNAKSVT